MDENMDIGRPALCAGNLVAKSSLLPREQPSMIQFGKHVRHPIGNMTRTGITVGLAAEFEQHAPERMDEVRIARGLSPPSGDVDHRRAHKSVGTCDSALMTLTPSPA